MIEGVLPTGTKPDAERRGCHDCRHCKAAVNWWCQNEEAVKARGTKLPTVGSGCPYWEPCRTADQLTRRELRNPNILVLE